PRPRQKIGKKEIERVERMRTALELRKAGLNNEEIAKRLGYHDRAGVSKLIREALRATLREPADALRDLEDERLDRLFATAYPKALAGGKDWWRATEMCLRIMERRAALRGLDAPARVTVDAETRNLTLSLDASDTET